MSPIFDFPGMGAGCPNTGNMGQYYLLGNVGGYSIPAFDYAKPQNMLSTIRFFNDSIQFPQWKVGVMQQARGRL